MLPTAGWQICPVVVREAEQVAQQAIQGLKFSTLWWVAGARTWIWGGWERRGQPSAACSACFLQGDACRPPGPALEGNSESGCWSHMTRTGLADGDGGVGSGDPREVRAGKSKWRGRLCSPHHPCYGALVGLGCTDERAASVLGGCLCALAGEEMRWHQKWVTELCGSAGPWGGSPGKGMRSQVEGAFCPTQDDFGQRANLLLCFCMQSRRCIH